MNRSMPVLVLILALTPAYAAAPAVSPEEVLVLSKVSGVCGVMQQMVAFQRSTQMAGGDEFITRFWTTEFARLGKSQKQFIAECEFAIEVYGRADLLPAFSPGR